MMMSKRRMTLTSQYEPGIAVLSNLSNDIYWLKNGDGARKRPCVFDDVSTVLFAGFAKNPCVLQFMLVEM